VTFIELQRYDSNRKDLKKYASDPELQLNNVLDLDLEEAREEGFAAVVLDFDGVLASHAESRPRPRVENWLCENANKDFPIYILSNKPTDEREQYFKEHIPRIKFIHSVQKKPYPDGIKRVIRGTRLQPQQILVVDDRLATGVLAAILAGSRAKLIMRPYTNFVRRPIRELFFAFLRLFERTACKFCVRG